MRMRTGWTRTVLAGAMVLCAAEAVWAQGAADRAAKPAMMAKEADPDWDVVTVKPSDPNSRGDHLDQHGRRVTFSFETVEMLLVIGYNVQKNQIVDAPDWVKTERWDIDGLANVDGEMNLAQLQTMIRKALAERFGLKLHRDQREMAVYALTVAKGGPKLIVNTNAGNDMPEQHPRDGNGQHTEMLKNFSMGDLALILDFRVDRPVVDRTGLNGRYDLTLKWTYDEDRAPTDGSAAPSLFTAMQEQLGLKLEAVKAPAPALVIDAIERPGAN
jgi:uncharacterized protein (TIGR03435 family)